MGILQSKNEFRWIDKYQLIDIDNNDKILKLMSRVGEQQYIGKEYVCCGRENIQKMEHLIDSKIMNPSPFLMRLRRAATKNKENICSDTRIFYLVFEKPYQTLKEDCISRRIKGGRFSEEEIDCILDACVKGMYYLKEMNESHRNVSTSSIFLREDRTVLLGDPWVLGESNMNFNLYGFTYPSPEKILFDNQLIKSYNHGLSDLFTLGIVLLETMSLEHMDSLYEKGFRRIRHLKIIEKINMISNDFLRNKLKILLDHEPNKRADIFRISDRHQNFQHRFISLQKEQFKTNYIRNHLQISEVKTIKIAHDEAHTIINRINESRDQSEASMATEPKMHAYTTRPLQIQSFIPYPSPSKPFSPYIPTAPQPPKFNNYLPFHINTQQHQHQPYQFQPIPQHTYYPIPTKRKEELFETTSFKLQQSPNDQDKRRKQDKAQESRQIQQNFQDKMSLSSIHQNSSRQSEQISNIQIMGDPKKEQQSKKAAEANGIIKQTDIYPIKEVDSVDNKHKFKRQEDPLQQNYHFNVYQFKKLNSTIKELSDQSPSREEVDPNTGQHEILYQTGTKYKGHIKNGMRDGFGAFYYKDGCFYLGEWKENRMHGKGKLYYNDDQIIYDGQWDMDCFQGLGKLYNFEENAQEPVVDYTNLTEVESYWKEYEGEFLADKRNGKGTLKLMNGDIFVGTFSENEINGQGAYFKVDGSIINGVWQKGILKMKI